MDLTMTQKASENFYQWIIGIFITLIIVVIVPIFIYFNQKLDVQEEEIAKLDKKYAVIVTFLNLKIPSGNLPALVNLTTNMNIPPEKVVAAINLLQTDPIKAKVYLDRELNFSVDQVNSVMRPIMI